MLSNQKAVFSARNVTWPRDFGSSYFQTNFDLLLLLWMYIAVKSILYCTYFVEHVSKNLGPCQSLKNMYEKRHKLYEI